MTIFGLRFAGIDGHLDLAKRKNPHAEMPSSSVMPVVSVERHFLRGIGVNGEDVSLGSDDGLPAEIYARAQEMRHVVPLVSVYEIYNSKGKKVHVVRRRDYGTA